MMRFFSRQSRPLLVLVLASVPCSLMTGAQTSFANPVSMTVVNRLNELPGLLLTQESEDLRAELTSMLGRYGIDLLKDEAKAAMESRFDFFASILIDSQRPGYRIDSRLQDFFWKHADTKQGDGMAQALHSWMGAEVSEAPASGSIRIAGPPSAVRTAILRQRIDAARALLLRKPRSSEDMVLALLDSCASFQWDKYHPCYNLVLLAGRDAGLVPSPSLRFVSEEIAINLDKDGQMLIEAEYRFSRVKDAKSALLWYPFPKGPERQQVESVSIRRNDSWVDVGFTQSDGGLAILLPLEGETERLRVQYRQDTFGTAEYILKTTALWGKPLESARFVVVAPTSFNLSFSLPLKKTADANGWARYELTAETFLPDRNLVLTW